MVKVGYWLNRQSVWQFKMRAIVFIFLLLFLSCAEYFFPYRARVLRRIERWPGNLIIIILDSVLLKILFPLGIMGIAKWAENSHWGLFNNIEGPRILFYILSFVFLDGAIYAQHVLSHKWNFFWRFHRVHHSDLDLDMTSALRFHPIEILFSTIYKIGLVLIFGIPSEVVIAFEIVLNGMAMFNHSNFAIPHKIEKILRLFFVTPQMHIIHHSIEKNESDANYGFNFSCWDFLFKTYIPRFLSSGIIGQKKFNRKEDQKISSLLIQPFN